jgi:predicted patatin/cPLA2 family phospholipase
MTSIAEFLLTNRRLKDDCHRKVALVVQGGGMRGIYSMGCLAELESRGLGDAFDVVIGASAGAVNGAYFLAGQANEAVHIYVDLLSSRRFVNPLRIWKIVNIDYYVDVVLKNLAPLDLETVLSAHTRLDVVLTDAETAEPVIVSNRDSGYDFNEVIRATAALPSLYNRRVLVGDRFYVDGGVADSIPLVYAADSGASEVMAVITRAPGFRRRQASRSFQLLARIMARHQSAAVRRKLGAEDLTFNRAMDLLEGVEERPGIKAWCVRPSSSNRLVGRTTSDKVRLRDCAEMGREDMGRALDAPYERSVLAV